MRHRTTGAARGPTGGRAFTLVELLVVIAIVAILVGILLAALGRARDHARAVKCGAQLHQVMIAFGAYVEDHRQVLFWRGPDLNGDGVFNLDQDGMDWFAWAGRETGNVAVTVQDDLFNRLVPRPLNHYAPEAALFRCPDDTAEWPDPRAGGLPLHEFVGNSYLFNSNGPAWDSEPTTVPADAATRGLGGKRFDRIAEPARTVMVADASVVVRPSLWHHGKGNAAFADGHVVLTDRETLSNTEEVTWRER